MGCRDSITQSKIQIPITTPQFIVRDRLLRQMEQSAERLVVLSASVGYGKTVLLTQYARRSSVRCAWYHLSETDNDCMVFMQYLSKAVDKYAPGFPFDVERYAVLTQDGEWLDAMAHDFADALHALGDQEFAIILDDFQVIDNMAVYAILQTVIGEMPKNGKIIIATKSAIPSFSIRHILHGDATVLDQDALCFNLDEVRAAVAAIALEQADETAEIIHRSAEGWPAGVRFCLLYLKQHKNDASDTELTTIYNKKIVHDYIMHELYRKMPYDIQMFLAKTSVLDVLGGDICNAVTQRIDSQGILTYLEQENLFILRMGKDGSQYRYHGIFKEFLDNLLKPDMRREVLDRAARFYLRSYNKEQAVEYAIANGNCELAQSAIESVGMYMLEQGKLETLDRWIAYLQQESARITARNHLIFGSYYYKTGDTARAMEYIEQALSMFLSSMDELGFVDTMLQKARVLRDQESLEASCITLEAILPRLRRKNSQIRYIAVMEKLYNLIHMGRYAEALAICSEMILTSRNMSNIQAEAMFMRLSSIVLFNLGQYGRAVDVYEEACRRCAPDSDAKEFSSGAYAALAYVFRGEYGRARELIESELNFHAGYAQQEDLWFVQLMRACVYAILTRTETGDGAAQLCGEATAALRAAEHLASFNKANRTFLHVVETVGHVISLCGAEDWDTETAEQVLIRAQAEENRCLRELLLGCLACMCYSKGCLRHARMAGELCVNGVAQDNIFTLCARMTLVQLMADAGEDDAQQLRHIQAYTEKNGLVRPEGFLRAKRADTHRGLIKVQCFGPFTVVMPGEKNSVKWRTKKAQELFAYLFHLQGGTVERDQLLCRLWPETATENAVSLLHTTLYSIRRVLSDYGMQDLIEYKNKKYRLNMNLIDSPMPEIMATYRALERGQYQVVLQNGSLLLHGGGDYMENIDGDWIANQREYLESMELKCYKYIAGRLMEDGNYEEAVVYLKRHIAVDPFAEFVYEMLMKCFGALGDVKNIKLYYRKLKDVLMEELGTQPDNCTRQVYYRCLGNLNRPVVLNA